MRSWLSSVVIASLALAPSLATAQPNVRDRGGPRADDGPREAPPSPRDERFVPRRGQTWVPGNYEWRRGKWEWKAGHYESRKKGKRWSNGKWDRQGDRYVWVAGTWGEAPKEPDPPPAPIEEVPQRRLGQVWVKGYWKWDDGSYDWVPGHLERRVRGKRWSDPHWDNSGGKWVFTAGAWMDAPKEPDAPPKPIDERPQFRRGYTWVAGYWKWDDGSYDWVPGHLEARKKGQRYRPGKWDQTGGKWTWNAGSWGEGPKEPDAPPPPIVEEVKPKAGFIWVKGYYEFKDGDFEWVAGHWERERAGKRWGDAHWDNVGGKWTFTAGTWQ